MTAPVNRGRNAKSPTEIPSHGWWQILKRVARESNEDRILLVAAGVTFYLLLALVPTITAFVSIYGLFSSPESVKEHVSYFSDVVPDGAMSIIRDQLNRISDGASSTLSLAAIGSIGVALWSANAGVKALFEGMNVAYDENESRGFLKLTGTSLLFTITALVGVVLLLLIAVALPVTLEVWQGSVMIEAVSRALVVVCLGLAATGVLAALYRWGPCRENAQWKWVTPGASVALLVGAAASFAFSWYVQNFGSYNETYGSLGAIIGTMTWLWIMTIFVMLGAELNAEMEHQTRRDTTTGEPEPMGSRGAEMADKVAHS